jgi:pre-mRNA-processing factor 19
LHGSCAPAEKRAKAGLTADVLEAMIACNKRLSKNRKKRPAPEGLADPEDIKYYEVEDKFPVHQASKPGVLALAILPGGYPDGDLVASGGVDTRVSLSFLSKDLDKRIQSLAGHKKKVLDVSFVGSGANGALLASGSADSTCKVWKRAKERYADFKLASTFQDHDSEVTAVCPHPTGDYLATASMDGTWGFYDLQAALCLAQMGEGAAGPAFTCGAFHPDGLIWGGGTSGGSGWGRPGGTGVVQVWDVKTQKKAAEMACSEGPGGVLALSFSENGYYLATATQGEAKVWDLRKLKCIQTLHPMVGDQIGVAFDHSGAYLGVCGSHVHVYGVKQGWECVAMLECDYGWIPIKKGCTPQVRFGPNAKYLAVAAGDHNLRYFHA